MKKVALIPLAIMLLSALCPAVALGKGASKAEITGPGLDNPILLAGEGQVGWKRLMHIAEAAGFFPATFGQSPDPMLDSRPAGDLGPRYRITYLMPGPNNELDEIRQDVYPYAEPNPVSYTPPGQPFFGSEQTRGGWYVASTSFLKDALIQAGLPEIQAGFPEVQDGLPEGVPTRADSGTFPWMVVGLLAALGGMLLFGAVLVFMLRRRPQVAR